MRIAKNKAVLEYQVLAAHFVRLARPSSWVPPAGYFPIHYSFYLRRDIDCDNAMKALNDAIAGALGINDSRFLPCVRSKNVNSKEPNPRVEVTVAATE